MSPVSVKVGGVWKDAPSVYTKVGGAWKTAADMPVKVGGVWKTGILSSGAFEPIATATGTGSSGTITFSSIPSTYQHLQIRMISRHDGPSSGNGANLITFNSDTGNNYTLHSLRGSGSAASAVGYATGTYAGVLIEGVPGDLTTSNVYGVSIVDIHDYASTSKYKTARIFGGLDRNDTFGLIRLNSSLWLDTSAISTITVTNVNGANFKTGSTFALYGIKGA